MKQLYLLLLLAVSSTLLSQTANGRRCGAYDAVLWRNQQQPGYLERVNETFAALKQIAKEQVGSRDATDTIFRVNVVFHVVYTNTQENIPDSVIFSQMEVLNEDYRRRNADTSMTRQEFLQVAADCGIEFQLASVDPDGNPTNGITRTLGTPGIFGFDPFTENMKSTAQGGKDPWPTDLYLNIWVCNLLNGLGVLGYAYPPSGLSHWPAGSAADSAKEGVVLLYNIVGRNNPYPIDATVDKGRSCVHEVGHYLGLRHIWADDQGACEGDAQGDSDGMNDTPDQGDAHQQTCTYADNSCPDTPNDFNDMLENYMDYSDDHCLNMFTRDQADMMRTVLRTSRIGIAEVITEVKETDSDFQIVEVFPNPSNEKAYVQVRLYDAVDYTLQLFNTVGEELWTQPVMYSNGQTHELPLQNLSAGLYLLRVATGTDFIVKRIEKF